MYASLAVLILCAGRGLEAHADEILIATGSGNGIYRQAGRAICRLVNRTAQGIDCEAISTAGFAFNLSNVSGGAIEIALVPSDLLFEAVTGTGRFRFTDIPYDNLRILFSVSAEPFTVLARRDSGIRHLDDLKGRRVNIGSPGSDPRSAMDRVMGAKGWTKRDFQLAGELPKSQQSLALCHGRVHATVDTVTHPDDAIEQSIALCDARLIDVTGPEIDALVREYPYYIHAVIPAGLYESSPDSVKTFGVAVTAVTSSEVGAELVHTVVKAVFDNLRRFRKMHPAFAVQEAGEMVGEGLPAPVHEGAVEYFQARRLM